MADINKIRTLAQKPNLYNIARGDVDIHKEALSNLDYLEYVLDAEQGLREQAALVKREKDSRLPNKPFSVERLNTGIAWQVEQLEKFAWVDEEQNLIIVGKCQTGKSSLVSHLGRQALSKGIKVSYNTIDDFLYTVRNKDKTKNRKCDTGSGCLAWSLS